MPQLITLNLDTDPDDIITGYGAGALIRLERDTTSAFAAAVEFATTAVVVGTTQYEIWDAIGTSTSWYRWRVSRSDGTTPSAYVAGFQAGQLAGYATVQALRETLGLPDNSRDNLLADCLRRASDWIGAECNRDFYRHPQVTGTEVRTYHLRAATTYIRDDIISLTTVEYALGTGQAYTVLTAANYTLDPATVDGVPFDALYLSDVGILSSFSAGYATVRLTGVFGYLTVPGLIEQATLDLAREMYQQGPGGRTVGVDFGRLPLSVQRAIAKFRRYIAVFA